MSNAVAIKTFPNAVDGVEARVWASADGTFAVTLFDVDSGETVPVSRHGFKTMEAAEAFAKECANV